MEKISTAVEKKEALLDSLAKRVEGVRQVLAEAEWLFDLPSDEAMTKLMNSELEFRMSLPESTYNNIKLAEELRERAGVLDMRLSLHVRGRRDANSLYSDLDVSDTDNELTELNSQIEAIETDPDFVYASTIIQGHQALWRKIRLQNSISTDTEIYRRRQKEYAPTDFVEVKRDTISTTHIVKESSWKDGKDVGGLYVVGTPFIYIRESNAVPEVYERILSHERKHLVLDGMSNFSNVDPEDVVKKVIQDYNHSLEFDDNGEEPGENILDYFDENLAEIIINNLHNEMLAEYETALDKRFGSSTASRTVQLLGEEYIDQYLNIEVADATESLSTAGNQFRSVIKMLEGLTKTLKAGHHENEAEYIASFTKSLNKKFLKIIYSLRSSAAYAELSGEEAVEDMRALVHILPPTKYRHIGTYLRSRFTNVQIEPWIWGDILEEPDMEGNA